MSTYHQLLYHIVFSTKGRQPWLTPGFREQVWGYLAGIARNLGSRYVQVSGYTDHVHLLVHIPTTVTVADFVSKVKSNSSRMINAKQDRIQKFGWQDGYGVFTVSESQRTRVEQYLVDQENHHSHQPFQKEYLLLLDKHKVRYEKEYLWGD